ncbi:hypothetical protein AB30_3913 [Escherichia coli 2-210-07_S1_C2]|uniref:hypothetical protein n=1 Tax=Escherichia coli TaxID=562 RepID=UPI0002D92E69|nr:hypothetical protein [Escherichia coli]KDW91317.1 hypothetical protein AB30_3913 [Escherichia coli 2-210-07_S1_C2]
MFLIRPCHTPADWHIAPGTPVSAAIVIAGSESDSMTAINISKSNFFSFFTGTLTI